MAYADVQMFMEKLKQLIYCNDIPMINNPLITRERPQFLKLYEELGSTIQTLFNHEKQNLQDSENVRKLKKRFKATAEEAEDIVDIFLSAVHCRKLWYVGISDVFETSLNLEDVIRSIKYINVEFMTTILENMEMNSSQRTDRLSMQSAATAGAGTSNTRNSLRSKKLSKEVVGLDADVEIIRDKLVEDGKHLDVVSIVGMGGLGKTTLANKVFTEPYVAYHFYVRGWVTVSQTYDKRDLLIQVLSSIDDQLELEEATDSQLHEMLHRRLYQKRYLIVIDDIWSKEAWDKLKLYFPDHNNGSRILLTSRLTEVAWHAKSHGLIHHLQHLTEEESWKLLCRKVFQGDECPDWLIETGMQIAKNCHGLPLSVVVMAGVLTKEPRSKGLWLNVSCSFHSYIASDEKGCLETIALSYDHLPLHLRGCFLYLGGFSEDFQLSSPVLLWLWIAEGFIQEDGSRSLEEIAKGYLMDLVDRNLLIVENWYISGEVRLCKVHDLVRQLCLEKGKEERFFLKIDSPPSNHLPKVITTYKQRRVVTNQDINIVNLPLFQKKKTKKTLSVCRCSKKKKKPIVSLSHPPNPSIRSLFCYYKKPTLINNVTNFFSSFALLRVLRLQQCELISSSSGLALLVHLRFLEIWQSSFPALICNLWNLQTLVVHTTYSSMVLPRNISNLVNLRHLLSNKDLYLPSIGKPMKLEVISNVVLGNVVKKFQMCFPRIKDLTSTLYSDEENDFEVLPYLQILTLIGPAFCRRESTHPNFVIGPVVTGWESTKAKFVRGEPNLGKYLVRFPATLKQLSLVKCHLPWSDMSIIQSLPNLQVLVLNDNASESTMWETGTEQFQQLKYLKLLNLNITHWEASSFNFPCLERLEVTNCVHLGEIPLELGDISTLEYIYVIDCGASLLASLQQIRQEQDDAGNYELKIMVDGRHMPSCVPNYHD